MVKTKPTNDEGEQTQRQIFESALQLFIERGFDSENQRRTRRMADGALNLTLKLLGLAKLAVLKPIRTRVLLLLRQEDLLLGSESNP
jgi:hypothetical protein